jgi:hypothetical protein
MKLHGTSSYNEIDLLPYILDPATQGLKVLSYNMVWDTGLLDWVKETQPSSGGGTLADQGAPGSLANGWPVKITDGTDVLGTVAHPLQVAGTVGVSGTVTITGSVSVSNFPATQAVTQSGTWNVGLNAGTNVIGHVIVDSGAITVSGTVTVDSITNPIHAIIDSGVITSITNPVAVTGTFWQATQPVSIAADVTVVQPTGTNLHVVVDSGTITAVTTPPYINVLNIVAEFMPGGSTFGTAIISGYGLISVLGIADALQDAAASLVIEFSTDNINWYDAATYTLYGSTPIEATLATGSWVYCRATITASASAPGTTNTTIDVVAKEYVDTVTVTGNTVVTQPLGSQLHTVVDSGSVNATLQGTSNTSDLNTADILVEVLAELRAMNADNGIFTDYI